MFCHVMQMIDFLGEGVWSLVQTCTGQSEIVSLFTLHLLVHSCKKPSLSNDNPDFGFSRDCHGSTMLHITVIVFSVLDVYLFFLVLCEQSKHLHWHWYRKLEMDDRFFSRTSGLAINHNDTDKMKDYVVSDTSVFDTNTKNLIKIVFRFLVKKLLNYWLNIKLPNKF